MGFQWYNQCDALGGEFGGESGIESPQTIWKDCPPLKKFQFMRLPDSSLRRTPLRFNITPMIDVVFLLIIFFLVASYFIRSEQSREVELPVASKGQSDEISSPHRLTITIEPDGHLSVGGVQMSEKQILKRIEELHEAETSDGKSPEVRIRSDRNARFGSIRTLIEHCAAHNIRSIRFAVTLPQG